MTKKPKDRTPDSADKLSSEDLAALIIDALRQAEIVKDQDVARALEITAEEIEVRKSLGDY